MNVDLHLLATLTREPQSTDVLCSLLNCTRRELQKAREALEEDYPVLSDQRGYWLAESPDEYAEVLRRDHRELKADARRYAKRKRCMRRTWPFYQESLFEIDEVA